jgi:hypothetical protein
VQEVLVDVGGDGQRVEHPGVDVGLEGVVLADQLVAEGPLYAVLQLQVPEVRQAVPALSIAGQIVGNHRSLLLGSGRGTAPIAEDVRVHLVLAQLDSLIPDDVLLPVALADDYQWEEALLLNADCALEVVHHLLLGSARERPQIQTFRGEFNLCFVH